MESVNARLNREAPTSYQTFEAAAEHIHSVHNTVLDEYFAQFAYNQTPRRKRRKEINERWTILTDQCEVFHNLPAESQAEHLINFLLKWSVGEPEPSEPFEQDPE